MSSELTRRQLLAGTALAAGAALAPAAGADKKKEPFGYMLNTATIMGQNLTLVQQVDVAAKAGYDAFEPWLRDLEKHAKSGKIEDVAKRIKDKGLKVESAIAFSHWIVNDKAARKKGLEQAKRDMDLVKRLGGSRIAAPPVGAHEQKNARIELNAVTDRYRALLELGVKMEVIPQVEVWGFSPNLSRLGETALVAIEARHPKACILADVYHLHKGGSGFAGLKLLGPSGLQVFHMNDYPAKIGRDKLSDADRVYPGDGDAPLTALLKDLHGLGFRGMLSLELFNRTYWKQDALQVARTGLKKMKAVVKKAL